MTEADRSSTRRDVALNWVEVVATVLLALATIATAWSGYQATRWAGETTKASAAVNAARISAARSDDLANAQKQVDVAVFMSWVDAFALGDTFLIEFYDARFREEYRPAHEAWLATRPLSNPDAPLTPFVMPEYVLAAEQEAARFDEVAESKAAESRRNIQRQSNYVLGVVLFATALFFAGMSSKVASRPARIAVLAMGCIVFVGTLVWVATMPVTVTV
jgi:hypothetical protein